MLLSVDDSSLIADSLPFYALPVLSTFALNPFRTCDVYMRRMSTREK